MAVEVVEGRLIHNLDGKIRCVPGRRSEEFTIPRCERGTKLIQSNRRTDIATSDPDLMQPR